MVDLKGVYRRAEQHSTAVLAGLFVLFALLIVAQSFVSGYVVLAAVLTAAFFAVAIVRPLWIATFLAVYLPFESFLLKFVPEEIYLFARYFSELLVYLLVAIVAFRMLSGRIKFRQTPADLPFVLFVVILVASAAINLVSPNIALLGMRQILRFMVVFFCIVYLFPPKAFIRNLTIGLFALVLFEAGLGILQAVVGAPLDALLLPSEARTYGDITLTSGVSQFWDPGSRVFATLGRYDRLGGFLYFFLLIAVAMAYEPRLRKERKELLWLFLLGLPALMLTYSRASWFGFLLGFGFIAVLIHRDKRVMAATGLFVAVVSAYLFATGLNVRLITEAPGQTLVERFYETFSLARWRGEYYGLGRVFWFVQTPLAVVRASPVFGFGPGMYGGGVVAALGNTKVYEQLGLPFGVYGTDGYIDNNWFSLWGETGTLGILLYLWIYLGLFVYAFRLYRRSEDAFTRSIALGFMAAQIGIAFNAFLSTTLEIRTTAYFLWLYAGFVVVLGERDRLKRLEETT